MLRWPYQALAEPIPPPPGPDGWQCAPEVPRRRGVPRWSEAARVEYVEPPAGDLPLDWIGEERLPGRRPRWTWEEGARVEYVEPPAGDLPLDWMQEERLPGRRPRWTWEEGARVEYVEPPAGDLPLDWMFEGAPQFRRKERRQEAIVEVWEPADWPALVARRATCRGLWRIWGPPKYVIRYSSVGPEGPWSIGVEAESLPASFEPWTAEGRFWVRVERFNGVLASGFLPIGARGETYRVLEIADGQALEERPAGPEEWTASQAAGGQVRVVARSYDVSPLRGTEWAIAYTVNATDPPEDDPQVSVAIDGSALRVLETRLPAQAHGTAVRVRVQLRRLAADGETWVYSEGSTVQEVVVDAEGPSGPLGGERWTGAV